MVSSVAPCAVLHSYSRSFILTFVCISPRHREMEDLLRLLRMHRSPQVLASPVICHVSPLKFVARGAHGVSCSSQTAPPEWSSQFSGTSDEYDEAMRSSRLACGYIFFLVTCGLFLCNRLFGFHSTLLALQLGFFRVLLKNRFVSFLCSTKSMVVHQRFMN